MQQQQEQQWTDRMMESSSMWRSGAWRLHTRFVRSRRLRWPSRSAGAVLCLGRQRRQFTRRAGWRCQGVSGARFCNRLQIQTGAVRARRRAWIFLW